MCQTADAYSFLDGVKVGLGERDGCPVGPSLGLLDGVKVGVRLGLRDGDAEGT